MLKINVGLSRKLTEDYNSKGYSLNIEGELPSDVLYDEKALAQSADRLFQLANLMLDEQIAKQPANNRRTTPQPTRTNGHTNGHTNRFRNGDSYAHRSNGQTNGNGNGHQQERTLTQAQSRALGNMTRKLELDTDQWVRDQFGCRLQQLTVKQASEAIDILKQSLNYEEAQR